MVHLYILIQVNVLTWENESEWHTETINFLQHRMFLLLGIVIIVYHAYL